MTHGTYLRLEDRALISISGDETRDFLQGLITNDIGKLSPGRALYAALLTPQGKYLHDFFVLEHDGATLLDCERARIDDLLRRLRMYKLRARIEIAPLGDELAVYALTGDGCRDLAGGFGGGVIYPDPRLETLGARAALPPDAAAALEAAGLVPGTREDYEALRLRLGVPASGNDLVADQSFLLECGFEELHGVDFEKGCYVGQEVTARMKHRALVRKRLLPVEIDGPAPEAGAPVLLGDAPAGEMRSSFDGHGIALLRLEQVEAAARDGRPFTAGNARLRARQPDWLRT